MTTFVLVPGACHGGWCFDDLAAGLRAAGHRPVSLTLTGLGDRAHLASAGVNLETHIRDVLAVLDNEQVGDAVLVGHSYGGSVITGVADRAADRVAALVYLDAFVPRDGESCYMITDDAQREWYLDVDETGYGVPPLPFFDRRATAHPLAAFLQPLRVAGDLSRFRRTYVYATRWPDGSPFTETYERVRTEPGWTVHAPASAHNLMRDVPEELLRIVLAA